VVYFFTKYCIGKTIMAIDPAGLNSQIANRQSENADMIPRIAQLTAEGQLDRAAQYQARLDVNNEFIAKAETALAADGGPPAAPTPTTSNPPDPGQRRHRSSSSCQSN